MSGERIYRVVRNKLPNWCSKHQVVHKKGKGYPSCRFPNRLKGVQTKKGKTDLLERYFTPKAVKKINARNKRIQDSLPNGGKASSIDSDMWNDFGEPNK